MVSLFPVTEDLQLEKNQGAFRNDADEDDSDLSEEEDFDPESDSEDSIQGPLVGFTGRGQQDAQSAGAPPEEQKKKKTSDKDKDKTSTQDEVKSPPKDVKSRGKTTQKPRVPNPDNYD